MDLNQSPWPLLYVLEEDFLRKNLEKNAASGISRVEILFAFKAFALLKANPLFSRIRHYRTKHRGS